jgi:hypothetical protein
MKIAHISLGPTCVPAEILKASGLRTCTFGFDWFRSSSFFVEEFLKISLTCFLERYVTNPCIPLRQIFPSFSEDRLYNTIEPTAISPIYGYRYLYNPHRVLDDPLTAPYYKRSYGRMRQAIDDASVLKRYLIADYVNKEHACHLDKLEDIAAWFKRLSLTHGLKGELYIVRISLTHEKTYSVDRVKIYENSGTTIYICNATYWEETDKEEVRFHVYQKLGKSLFGAINKDLLWLPSNAQKV